MKAIQLKYFAVIALALTFMATGCKHKPVGVTNLPGHRVGVGGGDKPAPGPGEKIASETPLIKEGGQPPLPENLSGDLESRFNFDRAALAANTVHFDYDSTVIRSNEKAHVQAVADYMKGASGVALLIEGHCDERGTEEYNRALGERRALALPEALMQLGADTSKITTRTYGKDRKIDLGNSEAAHAKNRRGEFVVLRPK